MSDMKMNFQGEGPDNVVESNSMDDSFEKPKSQDAEVKILEIRTKQAPRAEADGLVKKDAFFTFVPRSSRSGAAELQHVPDRVKEIIKTKEQFDFNSFYEKRLGKRQKAEVARFLFRESRNCENVKMKMRSRILKEEGTNEKDDADSVE